MVEVEPFECEDCRAIEAKRRKFHTDKRHTGDNTDACPECAKHIFFITERIPLDIFERR